MKPEQIADLIQTAYPASTVERAWDVLRILMVRRHGPDTKLPRATSARITPTWRQVLRMVCEHYDVPEADVLGARRFARVAQARFALQTVMVESLGMPIKEVAWLTHRDWSSVKNARLSLRRSAPQWKTLTASISTQLHHAEAAE